MPGIQPDLSPTDYLLLGGSLPEPTLPGRRDTIMLVVNNIADGVGDYYNLESRAKLIKEKFPQLRIVAVATVNESIGDEIVLKRAQQVRDAIKARVQENLFDSGYVVGDTDIHRITKKFGR